MAKIVQVGYDFRYRFKTNGIPVEEIWSLERVAAYMSAIEASRQISQRYVKAATFCSRLGMTYYELEDFDAATNHDLNMLTHRFVSVLVGRAKTDWSFLGKPLPELLDSLETEIKKTIEDYEKPVSVFGQLINPSRMLTRPTETEYIEIVRVKKEKEEKFKSEIANQISNGVLNKRVKISFGDVSRVCRVSKITENYLYLNVYDEVGVCIQNNMRLPKTSTRFISRFF